MGAMMVISRTHGSLISILFYVLFIIITACSNSPGHVSGTIPRVEPKNDSVAISIVLGNEQFGVINQELGNPATIQVVDNV